MATVPRQLKIRNLRKMQISVWWIVILFLFATVYVCGDHIEPVFPVDLKGPIHSSPIVADIDGDNENEILIGSDSDTLYCVNHNGYIKWRFGTGGDIISSPALGDIDEDGYLDVVFQSEDGFLYVLNHQGELLSPNWPQALENTLYYDRYSSTPALADIDQDAELEIITLAPKYCPGAFPYTTTCVYAFNGDGTVLWTWEREWPGTGTNVVTSPSIADVNQDGILDVVVYIGIEYHQFGAGVGLYALRGSDGQNCFESEYDIADTRSSPSLADINRDEKLDAVVSCFPPPYTCLEAITIEDDWLLWSRIGNPVIDNYSLSSPAFGNINADPYLEIIPGGSLVAIDKDGYTIWYDYDIYSYNSSSVLGDIDSDGDMEIFTAASSYGEIYGFDGNGDVLAGFPLTTDPDYDIESTPVLCDLDQDGYLDIIVGSTNGKLYRWDTDYEYNELGMAWPAFKNDIRRTGHYQPVVDINLSPEVIESHPGVNINLNVSVNNNSHLAHSIQVSLDARLPSGRVFTIINNFPANGYTLDKYTTANRNITLTLPENTPAPLDIWLRASVAGISGYKCDTDSSLVHVISDQGD